jgi:HAD superfamily hydrolase (TIGR01490 family)
MPHLAIFDLDGTLIPNPSAEWRFAGHLIRTGRVGPGRMLKSLAFSLRWFPVYGRQVWKKNKAYLSGFPIDDVGQWAEHYVHASLIGLLRPGVLARLQRHQREGDGVALLTGTLDRVAQPLARHLGIAHCMACVCIVENGRFASQPPESHPFGEEKRMLAESLCRRLGFAMHEVVAYADSRHDLPLLQAAGRAIAVAPDPALRQAALSRGWEILDA